MIILKVAKIFVDIEEMELIVGGYEFCDLRDVKPYEDTESLFDILELDLRETTKQEVLTCIPLLNNRDIQQVIFVLED